ncbi:MAG: hypothetical protein L0K86_11075 [Actinomycetia bacterium]|nr:hypothetical protein [Actinomycetes bacterium]
MSTPGTKNDNATLESVKQAVTDAWDFWLSQHDISVPDRIEDAVTASWEKWLDANSEKVIDRMAQRFAERQARQNEGPW